MESARAPFTNAVWHALTGPQRTVAERHGDAIRFLPDVAVFAALPDDPAADDWDSLRALVAPGRDAWLFRERVEAPAGWQVELRIPCLQMAAEDVDVRTDVECRDLGPADVPEMIDLVRRTEPGPFLTRTIALGRYVGVHDDDGALVAMAGERVHCDGWQEISAVCTAPEHRGRGLAAGLVRTLVAHVHDRGERAFLQVADTNDAAIRVYDRLGFRVCGTSEAVWLRAPA